MAKKKVKEIEVDEKSPEFVAFKKLFNYRSSSDKKSFAVTSTGSSISDEVVEQPPHYEISLVLFPDVSVQKFVEIAGEIYNKGQSCMDETHDYYDTHYPEYSFTINFVDLYRIYLKHQ